MTTDTVCNAYRHGLVHSNVWLQFNLEMTDSKEDEDGEVDEGDEGDEGDEDDEDDKDDNDDEDDEDDEADEDDKLYEGGQLPFSSILKFCIV